jgi:regulator of sigma E protease
MAGVAMNALIAYVIFVWLAATGIPQIFPFAMPSAGFVQPIQTEDPKLVIFQVGEGSAAESAGMSTGDTLMSINGQSFASDSELKAYTTESKGQKVTVVYEQSGEQKSREVTLGSDPEKGILGVVALPQVKQKYTWYAAPFAAAMLMWQSLVATVVAFLGAIWTLVSRFTVAETVTGPVGVTAIFGQVVKFGLDYVLVLVASISLSLAVINALPLPALDGGRLFILVLRRIGLPISEKHEGWVHLAGFALLILFGIIIAISDVLRFF